MVKRSDMEMVAAFKRQTPVNVRGLIDAIGVNYCETPMGVGESGRIDFDGEKYSITVNSEEGPQRRRFTAAHELGHYLLHRDLLDLNGHLDRLFDGPGNNPAGPFNPWHETQANAFAAETLMPAEQLRQRWAAGQREIAALANEFQVSRPAMRYRLINLGLVDPEHV